MKVTLRKVLLLALFVLVLTALFVVGASAATLDGEPDASITDDATAVTEGAVARIGNAGGAYYTTVPKAVTAAASGDTITLIADDTVEATINIGKNLTIDGNKHWLTNTATSVLFKITTADVKFVMQNINVDSANTSDNGLIRADSIKVDITVSKSNLFAAGDVFFLKSSGIVRIEDCTAYSSAGQTLQGASATCDLTILRSYLYATSEVVLLFSSSGSGTTNIESSYLTSSSKGAIQLSGNNVNSRNFIIKNTTFGNDATITMPDGTEKEIVDAEANAAVQMTNACSVTFVGNVTFKNGMTMDRASKTYFGTEDEDFTGAAIIKKMGNIYYYYNSVESANVAEANEIFTYSSATAATINSTPGYNATEVDGKYIVSFTFATLDSEVDETITDDASAVAKGAVARIGKEGSAYYTTLPGAVAAAAEGDTVTMLTNITVSYETGYYVSIGVKNLTLDGGGYKATVTTTASSYSNDAFIAARDSSNGFVLQNLTIDYTNTVSGTSFETAVINLGGDVVVTIKNCNITSNRGGIFAHYFKEKLTVENTVINAEGPCFDSGNNGQTQTLIFTDCELTSTCEIYPALYIRKETSLTLQNTMVKGSAAYGMDINIGNTVDITIGGTTSFTGTHLSIKNANSVVFDGYTGTQIIRQSDKNYTFFNNVADAIANFGDTDVIYTYDSTVAASVATNFPGYAAIEGADGKYSIIAVPTLDGVSDATITDDASAIAKGAVARIGTAKVAYFTTLSGAVAAVTDGGTVTLLANVALTEAVTVDKSITLDNNSYTVTATGTAFTLSGALATLTIDASVLSADKISGKVAKIEKENTVTYFTDVATAVGTMPLTNATVTVTLLADIGAPGNPLTLSDTWFAMPGNKNHNNLTLDGNGHTVIAVLTENKDFISARDRASFTLKNLTLDLTFPENSGNAILNTGGITAITIENCYLDSTGMGISAGYQRGNITVTNTEIRTVKKVYASSDNDSAASYTVIATFTNSKLISTNETAIISGIDDKMIFNGTTVHGGNGTDATFSADYATIVEINGNTQFFGGNISITVPNEIQFNTDAEAPYSGGQIIRMNTRNYYFYNVATDAVADFANGDKIFTYSSDAAVAISKAGFSVVEAEGVYTATERLDFTAIDGAINIANTAKQGASVAEKPCDVGAGKGYVLAADAQALEAAIIAAQTAKNSAMNNQQLAEAVAALSEAVAAFQAKIEEGKDHEAAEGAAACSTTCKYCNKVGVVSATDEHTVAIPCSDYQCSECGETVKPVDHERKYECSRLCKYCDAELFSNEEPHTREAACLKICKYCGEETFQDAAEHEQKAACSGICKICGTEQFPGTGEHERKSLCSNICKHCETEQFDDAVVCVGLVPCTDAICQYCGEAVTPVPHEGEVACDVTCKYCGEDVVTPVPHEGELPCDTTCKYCHVENAVTNAAAHDGEFACSTTCKYGCGTEITDAVECVGEVLCTSTTCKYCGEAVEPVPHSGLHACSTSCQYCGVAITPTVAHSFNYACDTNCKVCGEAIDHMAHTGAVPCAASCKYCGKGIVPGNHEGEYKCATVCQWCGVEVEPTKDHVKEHSCDLVCLLCQEETEQVHEYDNDCDANCNGCGLARNTAHKYDNDCDAECNVCKLTREITHTYKNKRDHTCELCGFDNAPKEEEGEGEKKEGLELWMIIAIAAGAVVVIAAVVVTIVIVKKKKKKATKDPGAEDASKEEPKKAKKEKAKKDSKKKAEKKPEKKPEEKEPEEKPEEKAEEKPEEAPEAKTEESSEEK